MITTHNLLLGEPSQAFKPPNPAFKFTKPSLNEPYYNFGLTPFRFAFKIGNSNVYKDS